MTRENKLALVVGFGLLLLVGILVSDHFSPARVEAAGDLRAGSDPNLAGQTSIWEPVLPAGEETTSGASAQSDSLEVLVPPTRPGDRQPSPALPADPPAEESGRPQELIPGDVHLVVRGDTLEGIARDHYRDRTLVRPLATYNRISDPATIRPGQRIELPPVEILRRGGTNASAAERGFRTASEPTPAVSTDSGGSAGGTWFYTVQKNDTLSEIASRHLGTATAWRRIFDLNRDILPSEVALRQGQRLRMPPKQG